MPVLVIDGRGFGHGVGMSQDGAFWMGAAGASTYQILGQFYPGTAIAGLSGYVRVAVFVPPAADTVVSFPVGGDVRDATSGAQSPGFPVVVGAGGHVRLWFDGRYHAQRLDAAGPAASAALPAVRVAADTTTTLPTFVPPGSSTTTVPLVPGTTTSTTRPLSPSPAPAPAGTSPVATSSRPLFAVPRDGGTVQVDARGRRYRGFVEASAASGPFRLVDQLDVEDYLRGMGEVRDPTWPPAALRTQAIAARTYALRAMSTSGELCDDERCQVYLGQQAEYAAMDRAVAQSQGQVLVYGRALASAVYSSNGGGVSASPEEGFGTAGANYPYLRAAPYLTRDPRPWAARVALNDVAGRFGYPGPLHDVRVGRTGPSGRALTVDLLGDAGPRSVDGRHFAASLGLRSTLFSLHLEQAAAPPAPPRAAAGPEQALPENIPTAAPVSPTAPAALTPTRKLEAPTAGAAKKTSPHHDLVLPTVALFSLVAAVSGTAAWRRRRRREAEPSGGTGGP